ncbi:MAG: MaoC family dehydratase N-terminal domain-containing protein [Rhodospirillales bacterium]|jgi:acyl dehydratase|nr:MaoC family dehydratase N-terminal domain-containing protein [Rhodospirillales bacterium]
MADSDFIGREYPPFTVEVEKGRIRNFARAIGDEDPIYFDEDAAKKVGFQAIPAPPTFAHSLVMDAGQSFMVLADMGIDKAQSVHGEMKFLYQAEICAGDVISGQMSIKDIYEKKGGALKFIETETRLENQDGTHVADLRSVAIIRNG